MIKDIFFKMEYTHQLMAIKIYVRVQELKQQELEFN